MHNIKKKYIVELRLDMFHYASNNIKAVGIFATAMWSIWAIMGNFGSAKDKNNENN